MVFAVHDRVAVRDALLRHVDIVLSEDDDDHLVWFEPGQGDQRRNLAHIELKAGRFEPEHLGKLEFYLEALDRDVRKPHERPSIGMLLCATRDTEVVEYALSRSVSPALIAEYQAMLPDKALLRTKLHEFYQRLALPKPEVRAARATRKKIAARGKRKAGAK